MLTLCDLFTGLSSGVWAWIAQASLAYRPSSVGFRETTITDILMLNLVSRSKIAGTRACVVHVPSEKATGADFELIVVERNVGTHFRLQAKRLIAKSRLYNDVNHHTKIRFKSGKKRSVYQIDTLCEPNSGFIPLYALYNWYDPATTGDESRIWEEGCCIAAATKIRSLITPPNGGPYLSTLPLANAAPFEWPWQILVCAGAKKDLSEHAYEVAQDIGAFDGGDWGNVRRPLQGPYLRLWQSRTAADGDDAVDFARPVIIVGNE